ncbi:MAG TPA: excinuclease ABC subunit A, partial [Chthoniobacteraceae bacterium]
MKRSALTIVPEPGLIEIRGARQNNLKGIDLDLPLGKLNVITGPSGSGKSSLAFDTVYAEGQRRYVETFSPYTRQFLERMDKPKVDEIRGIPPAIAIEQSNPVKTTRSTVGTMTEINDYLKLVMPRIVEARCPSCSRRIRPEDAQAIAAHVFEEEPDQTVLITFTVPAPPKTKPAEFFAFLQQQGYLRVWLEEAIVRTDEPPQVKRLPALVPVIQDRITINAENRARLAEALETALRFGKGRVQIYNPQSKAQHLHSAGWHCAHCDIDITPPTPGLFSFNHPLGACKDCRGFGRMIAIDLPRAIPDRSLSIAEGAVKPFQTENGRECQRDLMQAARRRELDTMSPFEELPKADQDWVMYGENPGAPVQELSENGQWYGVKGFFDWLETKSYKMHVRVLLARYRSYTECASCKGGRYQPATMNFRFAGKSMPDLMGMPVGELHTLFRQHGGPERRALPEPADETGGKPKRSTKKKNGTIKEKAAEAAAIPLDASCQMIFDAVIARLGYLIEVGLGYLSLDRPTRTLSGGEVERVNLTTCLGASLVNT